MKAIKDKKKTLLVILLVYSIFCMKKLILLPLFLCQFIKTLLQKGNKEIKSSLHLKKLAI